MKIAAVVLIALVLAILYRYSKHQDGGLTSRAIIPDVGLASARPVAPQSQIKLSDGAELKLNELHQITHLVFWAEWCEPCRRELPALAKIAREQSTVYKLVLINLDEDEEGRKKARELLKQKLGAAPYSTVYENSPKISEAFRVEALPYHSVIDKKGRIAATFVTSIEDDLQKFKALLNSLVQEPD